MSAFEIMYNAINANTTRQIADLILTLKAQSSAEKEPGFILWTAQCVLSDRLEKLGVDVHE